MLEPKYPWVLRYGVAVFTTIAATALTHVLWLHIEPALYPFFLGAVMISSWLGGVGPGLVSATLGAYFSEYFFLSPPYSINSTWENIGRILYFLSVAILICILNALLRHAQRRAEIHALEAQRNETLLRESQRELQRSEERYRLLVDGITDYAIFMLSPSGQILSWTSGAEQILGYREEEIIGQPVAILFTEEAIQQGVPERVLKMAATGGMAKENRWHIRKDGQRFWANCAIAPLWDDSHNLQGFSKIMQDITLQKQAEEERNLLLAREQAARQEAEAANQSKDEFLAILSHELRTPLAAITGWVGMLQSGKLNDAKTSMALETIERNATLQMQLIEDLLDISRIIRGDLWLDLSPVDVVEVVREATAALQPKAEEKDIQLIFNLDSPPEHPWVASDELSCQSHPISVLSDAERLQQVVGNLLSNAIKFTPEGGKVTVHLSVEAREENASSIETSHCAVIQVIDTGIGISPEFLPYVFDRFRQADSSNTRSHKGLGLGLAIAHYLVKQQGGIIEAHSLGKGQGATFRVKLPLLESITQRNKGIPRDLSGLMPSPFWGINVLVVDDEADMRAWLTAIFQMQQAHVVAAGSVDEALARVQQGFTPQIVISDIAMPEKDGYVLIRALKEREQQTGTTPLAIALSAYASQNDVETSLTAGFQYHLAKPIKADKLLTVIASGMQHDNTKPG